jgi:molybdopterin-guanine dinucleotide biosynthesis protein A
MTDPETQSTTDPIAGVILAGGLARRMGGGDKTLKEIGGRPMLALIIERLRPQVDGLVLNANGDPERFSEFGLPVVADTVGDHAGPLAGILAGMRWAEKAMPEARFIASAAGDTPFFPDDLVERLAEGCGRDEKTVAMAASANGVHPVFGLWPIGLADALEEYLESKESGKILTFADEYFRLNVPFDHLDVDGEEVDPFFNVNTPEDIERAEMVVRAIEQDEDVPASGAARA